MLANEVNEDRWHRLSFRIFGDNLPEPQEIEERLQLSTYFEGRKGQHIRNNPRYAKHSTSFWGWRFTTDRTVGFEEQISQVLAVLEPKATELKKLLALPGIEAELFLGYGSESGQGGAYFPASLITRVGALGLAMHIDLYPPGEWKSDIEA